MTRLRCIRLVDIEAAGGIEPRRLSRALRLSVSRMERGRFEVTGGAETHYVDLIDPRTQRCDCADHLLRDAVCQHLIACLLREGDERVIRSLSETVHALSGENVRLRANLRGKTIVLSRSLRVRAAVAAGEPLDALTFRRERGEDTSDVAVVRVATGEVIGRLTRPASRPEFVPIPQPTSEGSIVLPRAGTI